MPGQPLTPPLDQRTATRRRASPRRLGALLVVLLAAGYGAAMVWLVLQETRLVFRADRPLAETRPSFPYEQIAVPRADGVRQFAWVMKQPAAEAAPWVLYLHGNAATIASRVNIARYTQLREIGLNVYAPEYRGFAGLPGEPSEATVSADARAAYDDLRTRLGVAPARIVIYGWSLGSAVAVNVAAEVAAAAVILEGAPASLVDIGSLQYPMFPIRLLMRNPFDSVRRVDRIRAPILFLHSPEDTVIPIREGRRLYEAATAPKTWVEVPGGHTNANAADRAAFDNAIERFLQQHAVIGQSLIPHH